MRKILNLFFGLLLTSIVCTAQEATAFIPEEASTPTRLANLQKMMEAHFDKNGADVTVDALAKAVKADLLKAFPVLTNDGKESIEEDVTLAVAAEKLDAAAHEMYPEYNQEQLIKESEKRYPLYKKGQRVSIRIRTNPKKTEKVTGYYNGTVSGNIYIGQTSYRLADMAELPGNDGPEGEIAKFDPNLNRQYRQEWRLEYSRTSAINRQKFVEENKDEYEKAQRIADFLENESRGYTFYHDRWLDADELLDEFAYAFIGEYKRNSNEKTRMVLEGRALEIMAQSQMSDIAANVAPVGSFPSAEKELQRRAEEEKNRQEMKTQRELEQKRLAEAAEYEKAEADARRARELERAAKETAVVPVDEPAPKSFNMYVYGAVIAVVLLILGGWWWNRSRKDDDDLDVSKFYEGKGRLQQEFWDAANADPENFKYVSYLFPDMEAAKNALLMLSYIFTDENGTLQSKKNDLRFGFYEHQNGAVAFVGSTELNYARWREASMLWPEVPLSNYFKVSAEPNVSINIPDLDKINRAAGLHVTSLGAEDVRTESGEVNRVYRYKASNKEEAVKFLDVFEINEEGLVVRVTTAEGEFGKDINGVFMA